MSTNPVLDPLVQKFLNELAAQGGTPLYKLPVHEGRKIFEKMQAIPVTIQSFDNQEVIIKNQDGEFKISILRPAGNKDCLPIVVYMHGAGWVFGNLKIFERLMGELVNGTQAAFIFVHYTLAPEGTYPRAHEQGYTAAQWIVEHAQEYNLDNSRVAIAGDSVGGLMAAAIALMAKERKGPRFIFQLLFYPVAQANFETESYQQFASGYFLEREAMKWFWDNYVPDKKMRELPYCAPLNASLEQLKGLPPALLIVGECDVLRDGVEAYAHKLMQAGVPTVACRYLGIIHDFVMLNAITQARSVRAAITQAVSMLKGAFAKR